MRRFARRFFQVFVITIVSSAAAVMLLSPLILAMLVNAWLALTGFVLIPFAIAIIAEVIDLLENKWGSRI